MSSIGENALPAVSNPILMTMKGAAAISEQQQQQLPRQVLGNVGNAGLNLVQIHNQKKEQQQSYLNQDQLRKAPSGPSDTVIPSEYGFAIYTDENSNGSAKDEQLVRYSGNAVENTENLPPKHASALLVSSTTALGPISSKSHVEDKNRTPFSEIIVDTPADVKCASVAIPASPVSTHRERIYEMPDYQPDIHEYLKEAEVRFRPKPDYMRKQPDINGNMRTVLVDWIVEVCEEYRLNTETLYLAVSYVDRFLSIMSVVRSKLQLVGTSAMFIAAKLEEIYPPDVADFVYITDDTYTKKQVLRMEQLILRALTFDMSAPTAHVFVNLYAVMEDLSEPLRHLALYLCELSLLYSTPFLQYLPSRTAAAALAYARLLLNYEGRMWTRSMELVTGYELSHLQQVICELSAVHEKSGTMVQKAVPEKYRAPKYSEVALIQPVELTEAMFAQTFDAIAKELEEAVKVMCV